MFDTRIASIRFGHGVRYSEWASNSDERASDIVKDARQPGHFGPIEALLAQTRANQPLNLVQDIPPSRELILKEYDFKRRLQAAKKAAKAQEIRSLAQQRYITKLAQFRLDSHATILHAVQSHNGFFERLVSFWTNHFTISRREGSVLSIAGAYQNEAIRPFVGKRFADMLRAVALHPGMLLYLSQQQSIGPNSRFGRRSGRGLNENYARELLELHTIGVEGGYRQPDVRGLAELLTGIGVHFPSGGFRYRANLAEPGPAEMLGKLYGDDKFPRIERVLDVLDDLAVHPATGRYVAHRMARHFIADDPPKEVVASMAQAFNRSHGNLPDVYRAMLEHEQSWLYFGDKVKQPIDYVISTLRAVGADRDDLNLPPPRSPRDKKIGAVSHALTTRALNRLMQPHWKASGPNGWPEETGAWITPVGLARRYEFATLIANRFRDLDAGRVATASLVARDASRVRQILQEARNHREAMVLLLMSAQFNRR